MIVGRVAVKHCFKLLSFFTFMFAVLLQSAEIVIWFKYRCVQRLQFPIKGLQFWRFHNTLSEFCAYFSLHMRRNAYLRASGQKSDLAIRFGDFDFL